MEFCYQTLYICTNRKREVAPTSTLSTKSITFSDYHPLENGSPMLMNVTLGGASLTSVRNRVSNFGKSYDDYILAWVAKLKRVGSFIDPHGINIFFFYKICDNRLH